MNNNIPVSQTNLGGNKVSDLVEALLKLDQDIKVDVREIRIKQGKLVQDSTWVIDQFNAECATDMLSLDELIQRYQDLVEERDKYEKKFESIKELLDE